MATLQEYYCKQALEEINGGTFLSINHRSGTCTYITASGREITTNIIFPSSLINDIDSINAVKDIPVFFQGSISPSRQWLKRYANQYPGTVISHSVYGRDNRTKYKFHTEYYTSMKRAKFVLCPVGDCNWSYRFFEAMMCMAIPVMEKDSTDKFYRGTKAAYSPLAAYYTVSIGEEPFIYDEEKALENYIKVLEAVTLK